MTPATLIDPFVEAVDERYSPLSKTGGRLSCGGACEASGARPGELCVDLGSGRGGDALKLAASVGPTGRVYGIDISSGMISAAREAAVAAGMSNVTFLDAPFDRIPLSDGTVDLVISNCALNHAPDKRAVVDEIHRITKAGGRFTISDIYALQPVPDRYRFDPTAVAECWAGAITREEYLALFHGAGFQRIAILEESLPYRRGDIEIASFTVEGFKKGV